MIQLRMHCGAESRITLAPRECLRYLRVLIGSVDGAGGNDIDTVRYFTPDLTMPSSV